MTTTAATERVRNDMTKTIALLLLAGIVKVLRGDRVFVCPWQLHIISPSLCP